MGNIGNTLHDLDRDIEDYPDDEIYDDGADSYEDDGYGELVWPGDRRWRPAAAIVGVVVAVGAILTAVIIHSGDSATTKGTVGVPTPRTVASTPTTPSTTKPPAPSPSASAPPSASQLPSETFTTVPPRTSPSLVPPRTPTAAPPPAALPPSATVNPRTIVYSVTGTKQIFDMVNVVYTDERGFPVTEFNVSLPWTKMVVLNPGVQTESVIATSLRGGLSCAIVNAAGQPVVAKANNGVIATCTR
jgi:hypothetical protein